MDQEGEFGRAELGIDEHEGAAAEDKADVFDLAAAFNRLARGSADSQFVSFLIILSYVTLFCRPQNLPGLGFVGAIRLPMIISITIGLLTIPRLGRVITPQVNLMFFLIAFEGLRGLAGFHLGDDIVRNDFWHFHTWKDLMLHFFGLSIPLLAFMASTKRIQTVFIATAGIGFFLGFWSLTHSGTGPGGFVGDENDLCLVLLLCLPFSIFFTQQKKQGIWRFVALASVFFTVLGILATLSRGGFLGLIAVLGSQFLKSRRKFALIASGLFVFLLLTPFIPKKYYGEMSSIGSDYNEGEGTIQKRIETWQVVIKMWKDPRHTLFGVGLSNAAYWYSHYEKGILKKQKRSLSGRQAHSFYFQILGDLGLYGSLLMLAFLYYSLMGNQRLEKKASKMEGRASKVSAAFERLRFILRGRIDDVNVENDPDDVILIDQVVAKKSIARSIAADSNYIAMAIPMVSVSFLGVLAAGLGISVAYYPPVWFLGCLSATFSVYWARSSRYSSRVLEMLEADLEELQSSVKFRDYFLTEGESDED
jgi:hypothetical protein